MSILLAIIAIFCLGYVALAAWVYCSQSRLVYCPRRDLVGTPDELALAYEDIHLTNTLGTRIHGWWLPHPEPRFTLLFSHGNGGNISHRLDSLLLFHELGLSVCIYDYSGYGLSDGSPSEPATGADARAVWDWLVNEKGIASESIVLFGRSLGGAVTARLASDLHNERIRPAGLILESTFTSVPDMGAHMYPWLPVRRLSSFEYDSAAVLAEVRLPALFAHSPVDDIVPYTSGRALFESYDGPKFFMEMQGDHNSGFRQMGDAYPVGLAEFLARLERGNH